VLRAVELATAVLNHSLGETCEEVDSEGLLRSSNEEIPEPGVLIVVERNSKLISGFEVSSVSDAGSPGCPAVHTETELGGGVVELGIVTGEEVGSEIYISILSARDDWDRASVASSILLTHGVALGRNPVNAVVDDDFHVIQLCIQARTRA
jgi:hypothetical protein